ncbi:MAG: MarR family transcriptional regulator [Tannerellaceae bacterium]|nr:MarR family transcriptional regulator [Tannerellaceae bacterium]
MDKKRIEQPDEQLGFLLIQTSLLKQRIINAALKELDLTYMQFVILAAILELGAEDELVTQQLIASRRQLDKAMVSNITKLLILKKLMTREHHPTDQRALVLRLTDAGTDIANRGKEITKTIDTTFFAGIDEERLRADLKNYYQVAGSGLPSDNK